MLVSSWVTPKVQQRRSQFRVHGPARPGRV